MSVSFKYGAQPGLALLYSRGLTVAGVARAAGIPYRTAHYVLNGRNRPHPEVVRRLCEVLGAEPVSVFTPEALDQPYLNRHPLRLV